MSDSSSETSEENKFTPEKIEEKKTRPYLLVELFDKNINDMKGHALFEIGDKKRKEKWEGRKSFFIRIFRLFFAKIHFYGFF